MTTVENMNLPTFLKAIQYHAAELQRAKISIEGIAVYSNFDQTWAEDIKRVLPFENLQDFVVTPENYISIPPSGKLGYVYISAFPLSKRGKTKHSELLIRGDWGRKYRLRLPNFSYEYLSSSIPIRKQKEILELAQKRLEGISMRIGRTLPLGVEI